MFVFVCSKKLSRVRHSLSPKPDCSTLANGMQMSRALKFEKVLSCSVTAIEQGGDASVDVNATGLSDEDSSREIYDPAFRTSSLS